MKYIAYCRKSTDEKDKQILSIEQQISELREFASRENLTISEFLVEKQSAKVLGRKVFGSLIKKIEQKQVEGIVAWNPDRLARNSIDGGKIIYLIDEGKLKDLKFPTHWFDNTPQGKFMLSIAFGQSKYYVDNLSQNVKRGMHYKLKLGIWPTMAPFGYLNDRNERNIKLDHVLGKLINKSFEKFASGEFSQPKQVQDFFSANKVLGVNGKPIRLSKIKKMLTNPFYFGLMKCGGEVVMGKHKAIISKKTFDKVQEILNQKYNTKLHKHDFAFTGFIKCKECGCFVTAEKHFKNYKTTRGLVEYQYYRCTKKKGACSNIPIPSPSLEDQLKNIVGSLSLKEIYVNKLLEMLEKDKEKQGVFAKGELTKLSFSLRDLEKKLNKLLDAYLEEVIDIDNYQKKKEEITQKVALVKEKIQEVKTKGSSWIEPMEEFLISAKTGAKIAREEEKSHDLSIMAKKVGSNYTLFNKRLEFCPNSPYDLLAAPPPADSEIATHAYLCR